MIPWLMLLYHSLWVLGLALLLATFSLAEWPLGYPKRSLRQRLGAPPVRFAAAIGVLLVALGLTLLIDSWWHKPIWGGLLLLSLWESLVTWRNWYGSSSLSPRDQL